MRGRAARPYYRLDAAIQEELRSQYLLVYQSTSTKGPAQFRQVEVKVEDGLEVRAMSGYYP